MNLVPPLLFPHLLHYPPCRLFCHLGRVLQCALSTPREIPPELQEIIQYGPQMFVVQPHESSFWTFRPVSANTFTSSSTKPVTPRNKLSQFVVTLARFSHCFLTSIFHTLIIAGLAHRTTIKSCSLTIHLTFLHISSAKKICVFQNTTSVIIFGSIEYSQSSSWCLGTLLNTIQFYVGGRYLKKTSYWVD